VKINVDGDDDDTDGVELSKISSGSEDRNGEDEELSGDKGFWTTEKDNTLWQFTVASTPSQTDWVSIAAKLNTSEQACINRSATLFARRHYQAKQESKSRLLKQKLVPKNNQSSSLNDPSSTASPATPAPSAPATIPSVASTTSAPATLPTVAPATIPTVAPTTSAPASMTTTSSTATALAPATVADQPVNKDKKDEEESSEENSEKNSENNDNKKDGKEAQDESSSDTSNSS